MKSEMKKHSIIRAWTFSYIIVLAVPIIMSVFIYAQSAGVLQKEIIRANDALLTQIQYNIDGYHRSINQISLSISQNPRVQELLDKSLLSYGTNEFNAYKITEELIKYQLSVSIIDSISVYCKTKDTIISNTNTLDSHSSYSIYYDSNKISYDKYKEWLNSTHTMEFSVIRERNDGNKIAYIQSLPLYGDYSEGMVSILIDEDFFYQTSKNIEWLDKSSVTILDRSKKIISSTLENPNIDQLLKLGLNKQRGIIYGKIDDRNVVVSYNTSEVNGWKYIVVTDTKVFWEKSDRIRLTSIIAILLCIIFGGLITTLLVRRNYKPVNDIVRTLTQRANINGEKSDNDFSFIKNTLTKTLDEYTKTRKDIEKRKSVMKSAFLSKMIKGNLDTGIALGDYLNFFDIRFETDSFGIILFYVEEYDSLFRDGIPAEMSDKLELVNFIITNIVSELANENNTSYMFESDGMLACLINFNSAVQEDRGKLMFDITTKAQQIITEKFNFIFSTGISNVHQGIREISQAYLEALGALEYRLVLGGNRVIQYQAISRDSNYDYYYPLETEQKMINYIQIGDFIKSKNTLEEILNINLNKENVSINLVKCLMFDLIGTIIKTIATVKTSKKPLLDYFKNKDLIEEVQKCDTIDKIKSNIFQILEEMCKLIASESKNESSFLIEKIKSYITQNFQDINLSISTIADNVNLSTDYVSKLFKEATNQGLLDYISKFRIECAKNLLSDSSININDIGKQVGFFSTVTFIRSFKKFEGITPGEYRKLKA